jgi:hypothetical protein
MGNGSSVKNAQSNKGIISVQTVRAGARFKAGTHHGQGSTCTSQREVSNEEHSEKEESMGKR